MASTKRVASQKEGPLKIESTVYDLVWEKLDTLKHTMTLDQFVQTHLFYLQAIYPMPKRATEIQNCHRWVSGYIWISVHLPIRHIKRFPI